jgi:hypothetical protein
MNKKIKRAIPEEITGKESPDKKCPKCDGNLVYIGTIKGLRWKIPGGGYQKVFPHNCTLEQLDRHFNNFVEAKIDPERKNFTLFLRYLAELGVKCNYERSNAKGQLEYTKDYS